MIHPVFSHKFSLLSLFPFWIVHALIPAALLHYYADLPWQTALIDGAVYSIVMMAIGFSLWFPIGYGEQKKPLSRMVISNTLVGSIAVCIWLIISWLACYVLLSNDVYYLDLSRRVLPIRALWGVEHFMVIIVMYHFFVFYRDLEEKRLQQEVLKKQVKESELRSLKAQLNPHFLFNSLNSISALTISHPEGARGMLTKLSDLLRYSLRNKHTDLIPVCDEIQNIRRYMEIEKVRFGDYLIYNEEISQECLQCKLPAMILQPLFENAIKHGLYESLEPVTVSISCSYSKPNLEIAIWNHCDETNTSPKGEGLGLKSTKNILRNMYNHDGLIKTHFQNGIFAVNLTIPQNP